MAVVEGLSSFLGDMGKMDNQIRSLIPGNTLLEKAFLSVGDAASKIAGSALRTLEYAIGNLLSGAIESAISWLKDFGTEILASGNELQLLQLRLDALNFNSLIDSGKEMAFALEESTNRTQAQLDWIQKLAAETPFDFMDVANVYTLARAYGFADDKAQELTEAVGNFTSGMGLSDVELRRVIENLGQMVQQGKITGTELRDLARGAFVPVADVLDRVKKAFEGTGAAQLDFSDEIGKLQDKLSGYATDLAIAIQKQSEFTDTTAESTRMAQQAKIDNLRKQISDVNMELTTYNELSAGTGTITKEMFNKMRDEGIPAMMFVDAFIAMANDRFPEAAEKMARALLPAIANVKDLAKSFIVTRIIVPIFNVLGRKIDDFSNQFTKNSRLWEETKEIFIRIGDSVAYIIEKLLGLLPSAKDVAEGVVGGFDSIAAWLEEHKDDIVSWVEKAAIWIQDTLLPALEEAWKWLFGTSEEKGAIAGFFDFIEKVGPGVLELVDWIVQQFTKFSDWVTENQPLIDEFFATLGEIVSDVLEGLFGKTPEEGEGFLGVLKSIMQWVIDNKEDISGFIENLIKLVAVFELLSFVGGVVLGVFAGIFGFIASLGPAIVALAAWIALKFSEFMTGIIDDMVAWADESNAKFEEWRENLRISIRNWVVGAKRDFAEWANETLASILEWAENTRIAIRNWAVNAKRDIEGWATETWISIKQWFSAEKWVALGKDMIGGVISGIIEKGAELISTVVQLALDAYNALTTALQSGSPSKLFMKVGYSIDEGLAAGILGMAKDVGNAMGTVMGQVTAPAFATASAPSRSVSNNQQYTQNYNLNISSGANQENIVSDFEMLQSLAG